MISVAEIAERLNDQAASLAPDLLPNGHRAGNKWMASGIADTGRSASLFVHLSGARIGHWCDMGNAAPGEERGDMIDLLRLVCGLDAKGAVDEAKRRLGIQDEFTPGAAKPDAALLAVRAEEARARAEARQLAEDAEIAVKIRRAKQLFLSGEALAGSPAEAYLLGRAIRALDRWPRSLRFHPEVWHREERCKLPALLCAVYRADGAMTCLHRIYLCRDRAGRWGKLLAPPEVTDPAQRAGYAKRLMPGLAWGGFVPIAKGASGKSMAKMSEGEPVYVTEGIEDALVVRMMLPAARVVAAINLSNMGGIVLPPAARTLVMVCDRDTKAKAQEQLERSIAQQQARGLIVQLVMPPESYGGEPVKDVNDWHRAILRAQSRQGRAA